MLLVLSLLLFVATASSHNVTHRQLQQQERRIPSAFRPNPACLDCSRGQVLWSNRPNPRIPCGLCVTMDVPRVIVSQGLDIQGVLTIDNDLYMEVPFVRVQGQWNVRVTAKRISERIRVVLTGVVDADFVPAPPNQDACQVGTTNICAVGPKAIVVAGGQVNIEGMHEECKTWTKLVDVVDTAPSRRRRRLQETSSSCDRVDDTMDYWTGGYGASYEVQNGDSLRVYNRLVSDQHGLTLDLWRWKDCLQSDQDYLLRFSLKVSGLSCAQGGSCWKLVSLIRTLSDTQDIEQILLEETNATEPSTDEWKAFYGTVRFEGLEDPSSVVHHLLRFEGIAPEETVELRDFSWTLPVDEKEEEATCDGNLVPNGQADLDEMNPYPITSSPKTRLFVRGRNPYFRLERRSVATDSILAPIAPSCLTAGTAYTVSARVRVRSRDWAVRSTMVLHLDFGRSSSQRMVVADCPASQHTFVECKGTFFVDTDCPNLVGATLGFETQAGALHSFDVDDWSMTEAGETDAPMAAPTTSPTTRPTEIPTLSPVTLPPIVAIEGVGIIVEADGILDCWSAGSDILITSHTSNPDDRQIRRLVSDPRGIGNGLAFLDLDRAVDMTISERDGDGFAVEVALLERSIVFEGDTDERDALMGAHMIVFHTPLVEQTINGAEFLNFGRQGMPGRYPVHIHLSLDVSGSVVSKNLIRESNQRCIVVHGSCNLTIADNVAYEHKGHCFMTEDGGEMHNKFIRNLGAGTERAQRIVRPWETDASDPTTFWASNPMNEWIGNVAAGSETNGFWFELLDEVRAPSSYLPHSQGVRPRRSMLKLFRDNVAHSNRVTGVRTYPIGMLPPSPITFHNTKSYKNGRDGIFAHNSHSLVFTGGVVADNRLTQIDIDRADDVAIHDMQVSGLTEAYENVLRTQRGSPRLPSTLVGIELHSWAIDTSRSGANISGVQFTDFARFKSSMNVAALRIDDEKRSGSFDFWSSLRDIEFEPGLVPNQVDFRIADEADITNVYLTDVDSSLKPPGSETTGTSSVVSINRSFDAFLGNCNRFDSQRYAYCPGVCLSSVTFGVDPAETEEFVLVVTDKADGSKSYPFPGSFYNEMSRNGEVNNSRNTDHRKRRYFVPALPAGSYSARFRENRGGALAWPRFVERTVEPSLCSGQVDIELIPPPTLECSDLIQNGDMEDSNTDHSHWLHVLSSVSLARNRGRGGSNAIVDHRTAPSNGRLSQHIDTRCMRVGDQYDFRAWVRLVRNGSTHACDGPNCPHLVLRGRFTNDVNGTSFGEFAARLDSSFARPYRPGTFNMLQTIVTVDERMASADSVVVSIQRGLSNVEMLVDDVSMELLSKDCSELVFNGDFSDGTSAFWSKQGSLQAQLSMVNMNGNAALRMTGRRNAQDTMTQEIRLGCLTPGERYEVSARVRLSRRCNPSSQAVASRCPVMRLRSRIGARQFGHAGNSVAQMDHDVTNDGWQTMSGFFLATDNDENADRTILSFSNARVGDDLVVDDVSIKPVARSCANLFTNGNLEAGDTAQHWRTFGRGNALIEVLRRNGSRVLRLYGRTSTTDGVGQWIDTRCATGSWRLTARMMLQRNGIPVACDPTDNRITVSCPQVSIFGYRNGRLAEQETARPDLRSWTANAFNNYSANLTTDWEVDRIFVVIRQFNAAWDLLLDDISLSSD